MGREEVGSAGDTLRIPRDDAPSHGLSLLMRACTALARRASTAAALGRGGAKAAAPPAPLRRSCANGRDNAAGSTSPPSGPPARAIAASASTTTSADFPGRQVRVSHILLPPSTPDPAAALAALRSEVTAASDPTAAFADAARRISTCPSGASSGGDLGWVARGATVPPFEEAAFATATGALSTAETDFGFHLLTVTEDRAGPVAVRQIGVLDLKEILEGQSGGAGGPGDAAERAEAAAGGAEVEKDAPLPLQLVDVREAHEFETAALPGFILRPLSAFDATGLDPAVRTLVLCHHGVRSARVAAHLVSDLGFTDVWNVSGGIDAYARLADRSVPLY